MDFDCVLNNIRELNILAGEGCSDITRTKDGARLKVLIFDWDVGGKRGELNPLGQ